MFGKDNVIGIILMLPIILCGIVATFIIIERCIYFYQIKKKDTQLMKDVLSSLDSQNFDSAAAACTTAGTPCARAIKTAIDCRLWNEKDMRDSVEVEMGNVIPKFEHLLTALGTIANISTLLGLLGTVVGNIQAFGVLGNGGSMGDPAALAGSIGNALFTTVAGLVVSIPSLIFYNFFNSRVNRRTAEMEANVTTVVIKLSGRVK